MKKIRGEEFNLTNSEVFSRSLEAEQRIALLLEVENGTENVHYFADGVRRHRWVFVTEFHLESSKI